MKPVITIGVTLLLMSMALAGCETQPAQRRVDTVASTNENAQITPMLQSFRAREVLEISGFPRNIAAAIERKHRETPRGREIGLSYNIRLHSSGDVERYHDIRGHNTLIRAVFDRYEFDVLEATRTESADFILHVDADLEIQELRDERYVFVEFKHRMNFALEDRTRGLIVARDTHHLWVVHHRRHRASQFEEMIILRSEWE